MINDERTWNQYVTNTSWMYLTSKPLHYLLVHYLWPPRVMCYPSYFSVSKEFSDHGEKAPTFAFCYHLRKISFGAVMCVSWWLFTIVLVFFFFFLSGCHGLVGPRPSFPLTAGKWLIRGSSLADWLQRSGPYNDSWEVKLTGVEQ